MIEAQELTRKYGDFTAVDGVSFAVPEGEIVGILGPNGAGKTTTIRMITGFLPPTTGRVTLGGRDLFGDSVAVRREIGYLPESVALYPEMRVEEYLDYRGRLEGMERTAIRTRVGNAKCYVSFDVDFLDPAFAPGTGTPVVGGFSTHQALELVRGLAGLHIVGMDVVEVSPPYDHAEITAFAGASVAQELIAAWASGRKT